MDPHLVQMRRLRHFVGTGLISVVATSFSTLSTANYASIISEDHYSVLTFSSLADL
ncbi:hypothetical protein JB92DRAFT_3021792 [Gautieria morchelliformis]|nr:hypothetical protein JB92DRAFT_3021792 [Gautieria morchelliformis]